MCEHMLRSLLVLDDVFLDKRLGYPLLFVESCYSSGISEWATYVIDVLSVLPLK